MRRVNAVAQVAIQVQPDLAHRLLARATLALGAEIQILTPETDEVVLRQLNTVHDTESIGVRAWTAAGAAIERRFDGQPGNMTEPQRAPLDSIRGDLTSLLPTTPPSLGRAPRTRLTETDFRPLTQYIEIDGLI